MREGAAEVDKDLSEFWWQHSDFGVASRAGLVALGVGVYILYADSFVPSVIVFNELNLAGVFAA